MSDLVTTWAVAHQAPLSMARKLEWIAISFPGDLPDPGMRPASPVSPHCRWILYCWATREAIHLTSFGEKCKVQNNTNDKPDTNSTYKYDICMKRPKQGNFCRQEADWWLPGSGDAEGSGEQLLNGFGVSFWGDGNTLQLEKSGGCATLQMHWMPLNGSLLCGWLYSM